MRLCMGCMEKFNETLEACPCCGYVPGTPPVEAYHIIPGMVIHGKYIVGRAVGFGGFGVTYIGMDQLLEKKVAIKEYLPGEFSTRVPGQTEVSVFAGEKEEQFQKGVDKFVDEARRLAAFQNLNRIVQIFDAFQENGTAYIVMEYLEGETLKQRLDRVGKMSVEDSLKLIIPVAVALGEVHKEGIIHRDIAPDNLFLTKGGDVKVLDFGAARNATVGRSRSLSVIVKMGFAPPEQYQSKGEQGSWTDVYALAATFYRMITGIDPEDSMVREVNDTLKPPSKLGVKISTGMENALMNAMQLSVRDRTQSMEELIHELERADTKRKKVKKKGVDTGKWTLPMKLGVGVSGAAVIVVGVLLATGVIGNVGMISGNESLAYEVVPDLTGMDYETAAGTIENMGMSMKQAAYSFSDTMAENLILIQSIEQGTRAEQGEVMEVIVSLGKERRALGDVIGFAVDAEQVKTALTGFEYSAVYADASDGLAEDSVLEIQDESGTAIDPTEEIGVGNVLRLLLAPKTNGSDAANGSVPSLTGLTFEEARNKAKENGFLLQKSALQSSETVPKGSVISQSVEEGTAANAGTVIQVVISSGARPKVAVANVLGKAESEAKQELEAQGFAVSVTYEESSLIAAGNVIRTNPQVGEEVYEGSELILVVSSGAPTRSSQGTGQTKSQTQTQKQTQKKDSDSDSGFTIKSKDDDKVTFKLGE